MSVRSASGARVVVTGGAGFIGSSLVRALEREGARITAIDNLVNGTRENLADCGGDVALRIADVRDSDAMRDALGGADVVFHLACLGVRHSIHSPHENHDVNATATLRLLEAAKERGVGRFVYVSSSEVYGTARYAPMGEDHPTFPMTVYGAAKLAGECYTRAYHRTYGCDTVVVRPFNAYGPRSHHEGDSGEVIPKFVLRALAGRELVVFGDGTQTRDFTFVDDTARGILLAGFAAGAEGETLNIGNGREITVNELATAVLRVTDSSASVVHRDARPGDVLRLCADTTRARGLLGFAPTTSLADGLAALRDWYARLGVDAESLLEQEIVENWRPASRPAEQPAAVG